MITIAVIVCVVLPLAAALWWATRGREMAHLQDRLDRYCR